MSNTERRGVARKTEIEERSDGSLVLTGYAAVFYRDGDESTQFRLWPGAVERVTPGAFSRTLKEGRSVALLNHDDNHVQGAPSAGTARGEETDIGLRYEIDLDPEDPFDRRLAKRVQRGDISGSSFGFIDQDRSWDRGGSEEVRHLVNVDLIDFGPVTYPAYSGTTTEVAQRSRADWDAERQAADQRIREALGRQFRLARLRGNRVANE